MPPRRDQQQRLSPLLPFQHLPPHARTRHDIAAATTKIDFFLTPTSPPPLTLLSVQTHTDMIYAYPRREGLAQSEVQGTILLGSFSLFPGESEQESFLHYKVLEEGTP